MKDSILTLENDLHDAIKEMNEDGLTPELEERLNELTENITTKVDSIGHYFIMREQEIDGFKRIMKMYADKKKSLDNQVSTFKKYLAGVVQAFGTIKGKDGKKSIKGSVVTIKDISKLRRIYDRDKIEDEYKNVTFSVTVTKEESKELREYLNNNDYRFISDESIDTESIDLFMGADKANKVQGVGGMIVQNTSILGLKKLKEG